MVFSVGKQNIQETKGCLNVVFLSMCKRVLGCTPLYKQYRYAVPQKVASVFPPFRSENGYTFCPYWSGIGYSFRGN